MGASKEEEVTIDTAERRLLQQKGKKKTKLLLY